MLCKPEIESKQKSTYTTTYSTYRDLNFSFLRNYRNLNFSFGNRKMHVCFKRKNQKKKKERKKEMVAQDKPNWHFHFDQTKCHLISGTNSKQQNYITLNKKQTSLLKKEPFSLTRIKIANQKQKNHFWLLRPISKFYL